MAICNLDLSYVALFCCFYFLQSGESAISGGFRTTQIGPKPIWNETHLDRLKKDLLMNYDKYARPEHHANATTVNVFLTVLHIETDERKSILNLHSWLKLEWKDSKLKWNESNYGGLSVIRVGDHEVWRPDVYLYNTVSSTRQPGSFGNPNVLVSYNGKLLWIFPVKLAALCEFNLRYWPFDTQHCYLKFGSWVYSDNEQVLKLHDTKQNSVELESTLSGSSWSVNTSYEIKVKKYECCVETYSSALFNFTLTRKSSPYCAIIVTPAIVTTFLVLIQFWLPPEAGEKILINGFTFVVLNMFLLYFNHQVLGTASETPLIVLYYSSSLYVVGFAMVGTIISFTLSKIEKQKPLPRRVKLLLEGRLGKWLFLDHYLKEVRIVNEKNLEEMKDHQVSNFDNEITEEQRIFIDSIQLEWMLLLVAIDRIYFVLFCFVYIMLAIAFL